MNSLSSSNFALKVTSTQQSSYQVRCDRGNIERHYKCINLHSNHSNSSTTARWSQPQIWTSASNTPLVLSVNRKPTPTTQATDAPAGNRFLGPHNGSKWEDVPRMASCQHGRCMLRIRGTSAMNRTSWKTVLVVYWYLPLRTTDVTYGTSFEVN